MADDYIEDKTFTGEDISKQPLPRAEYEYCQFINCNFSGANLSHFKFIDCSFEACNLSLALLGGTLLRDIKFKDCKMIGLLFNSCNPFGLAFSFHNSILRNASFSETKLKKTVFKSCDLQETDFAGCDLTEAVFDDCNLDNAIFDKSILDKADLRTAYNYTINPQANRIKKARFSIDGLPGLLHQYQIVIEK